MKGIAIIGGDLRQTTVARLFQKDGYDVCVYGFDGEAEIGGLNITDDFEKAVSADIIILPVPVSYDGVKVNAPFSVNDIRLADIFDKINENTLVLGGKLSEDMICKITEKKAGCCDYLNREEMSVKNAIPTAEGAIQIAMEETPITIWGSKCLILGYGRIAKALSKMLGGIGAKLSIAARKCSDIAWVEERGYHAIPVKDLKTHIGEYDIIFNTIPTVILDRDTLKEIRHDALVIDLASKPGGVDFETAKDIGLNVIWALSLPGKVAPVTSGKIIKDTVVNILNEMEV